MSLLLARSVSCQTENPEYHIFCEHEVFLGDQKMSNKIGRSGIMYYCVVFRFNPQIRTLLQSYRVMCIAPGPFWSVLLRFAPCLSIFSIQSKNIYNRR